MALPTGATFLTNIKGDEGPQGPAGPANRLLIGAVETIQAGLPAEATIRGTAPLQYLDLKLPRGLSGTGSATTDEGTADLFNTAGTLTRSAAAAAFKTVFDQNRFVRRIEEFLNPGESLDPTRTNSMSAIFQRAINALGSEYQALLPFTTSPRGFVIEVPAGHYRFNVVLAAKAGVGFRGQGMNETFFYHAHTDAWLNGTVETALSDQVVLFPDVTFKDFTIDGALQPVPSAYDSRMKGIFMQSLDRFRCEGVRIRNTLATGFGFDYIKQGEFINCIGDNAGRGHRFFNDERVGSGSNFGYGSGLYETEDVTFRGCYSTNAYTYGFFIELVASRAGVNKLSRGVKFIDCHGYGNWIGFLDAGGRGASISACTFARNLAYGFGLDGTHAAPSGGVDGSLTDTIIEQNGPSGSDTHSGGGILIAVANKGGYTFGADLHIRDNRGPGYRFTNESGWDANGRFFLQGKVYRNAGAAVRAARSVPPRLAIENMSTWGNTAALEIIGSYTATEPRIRFCDFAEDSTITQTVVSAVVQSNIGIAATVPASPKVVFDPAVPGRVTLTWTAPVEGASDYRVEWQNTQDGTWNIVTRTASTATSQVITGLPSFAKLLFRVATLTGSTVGTYATSAPIRLIPTAYAADRFNRADGVLISAPDGSTVLPWNDRDAGNWSILEQSIRPTVTYANTVRKALTLDTGAADGAVQVTYFKAPPVASDISTSGMIVRYVDANNYVVLDMSSTSGWRLRKRVGGTYSVIIDTVGPVAVGDVVLVQFSGNAYTVTLNDRTPVKGTDAASSHVTATSRGLLQAGANVSGGGSPMKWDDFYTWNIAG